VILLWLLIGHAWIMGGHMATLRECYRVGTAMLEESTGLQPRAEQIRCLLPGVDPED